MIHTSSACINPLDAELNPIRHLLALVGAHHIVHVSGLRVKQRLIGTEGDVPSVAAVFAV